jgi:DDE_Tnp_1-associated
MSSSPAAPLSVEQFSNLARPTFLALLEQVPDPRHRRGVRHRLAVILTVGLAAVIAGARSFAAIGEWAADVDPGVLGELGADGRRPSKATIRRAFTAVDGDRLDGLIGAWMRTRVGMLAGRHVIAIDGAKGCPGHRPAPGRGPGPHRRGRPGTGAGRPQEQQRDPRPAHPVDAFDLARSGK